MGILLRLLVGVIVACVIVWLLGAVIASPAIVYLIALLAFLLIVFSSGIAL